MLKLSDDDFYRVVNFIKTNYGINLEKKRILIESRLTGIAAARGYDNFTDYLDHALNDSGREKLLLINSLPTNHTSFMREPDHFRFLETDILPYIENYAKLFGVSVETILAKPFYRLSPNAKNPYKRLYTVN